MPDFFTNSLTNPKFSLTATDLQLSNHQEYFDNFWQADVYWQDLINDFVKCQLS